MALVLVGIVLRKGGVPGTPEAPSHSGATGGHRGRRLPPCRSLPTPVPGTQRWQRPHWYALIEHIHQLSPLIGAPDSASAGDTPTARHQRSPRPRGWEHRDPRALEATQGSTASPPCRRVCACACARVCLAGPLLTKRQAATHSVKTAEARGPICHPRRARRAGSGDAARTRCQLARAGPLASQTSRGAGP